ncbi:Monooxygenase hypC [Metarhizium anisopliae]|nr:Monooxygenase hypC [Metarhizium anisopliae]
MATYQLPPLVAVAAGIVGSSWMSGVIASLSVIGVPTAQQVAKSSVLVWHGLFSNGMALMPKCAVATALSYSYAAYGLRGQESAKAYLLSAGLVVAIIPFTLVFMSSTNASLLGAVKGTASLSAGEVSGLIRKWGYLNLARSFLPLVGGVVALSSLMKHGGILARDGGMAM